MADIPDNIEEWFKSGDFPSSRFATLVLRLLAKYLEAQNKSFQEEVRVGRSTVDGVAPEGIDDLPGPTMIEIKVNKVHSPLFTTWLERTFQAAQMGQFRSILLVIGSTLSSEERKRIREEAFWMHFSLQIWDLHNLTPLLQQYAEYVSDVLPEVEEVAVSNVVRKSAVARPDEWKDIRQQHIQKLKDAFVRKELALFLGAGVSKSAGVPDWEALLSKLFLAMTEMLATL